jgi:hypothetical protein
LDFGKSDSLHPRRTTKKNIILACSYQKPLTMKKSAIRLLFTIISFFTLTNFNLTFAQTKTITGYVHNKAGQPLEVNMTLNTPKQDNTKSNPDGSYTLITEDFPTGIRDIAKQDNTKIWPNPARTKANMQLPALEGTLEAYDLNGKLLGKINLSNTDELTFNATNFALIRYVNKNEQSTQKLLIEQGNNTISVQAQSNQEPKTKSGLTETFGYKITFTGENIQDTTIAVENFDKNQTTHNQNHTLDELITKIKNLPDSATTSNSVTINLKEYFKNDDETTYTSNDERITFNGDYATIDLTKGNVNATINAQEPGRNVQSNTFNITKYQTINGTLTNIENDEPIPNATILGWDGQGNLIYTTTNENGEYDTTKQRHKPNKNNQRRIPNKNNLQRNNKRHDNKLEHLQQRNIPTRSNHRTHRKQNTTIQKTTNNIPLQRRQIPTRKLRRIRKTHKRRRRHESWTYQRSRNKIYYKDRRITRTK